MRRTNLSQIGINEAAARAAAVLRAGGVVLYPTDTLYALGADALSDAAVDTIFEIKGRRNDKPMHAIVSNIEMAERYGAVNEMVRSLAARFPKGTLSFVVPKREIDTGICRGIETFGFRIPDNAFCMALTQVFGAPITATSANASGFVPLRSVDDILAQLGASAVHIDLVIDAGELPEVLPSTVVDCTGDMSKVLREGSVPAKEIVP